MRSPVRNAAVLATLLVLAACTDGPTTLDPAAPSSRPVIGLATESSTEQGSRHQRMARRLARALQDDGFRATVYRALSESREREGKVSLQHFLAGNQGGARRRLSELSGESDSDIGADLAASLPIEFYLPVPGHRRAWTGGADVLVATAETDRESPTAYDTQGRRRALDPLRPPATPVIALGRAELVFGGSLAAAASCFDFTSCEEETVAGDPGSGSGASLISPGLYMTYAKFNETFEGIRDRVGEVAVAMAGFVPGWYDPAANSEELHSSNAPDLRTRCNTITS